MSPATRRTLGRLSLVVGTCAICLLATELFLRSRYPYDAFGAAWELPWMRGNEEDLTRVFTVDPEFGFRPILGEGPYTRTGTLANEYSVAKRPGVDRVLFVGDSITRRGRIVAALRRSYGDERFEFWNAGVESFNTVQEAKYYERFNRSIRPDHVILTFANNDFETTPIAFVNDRGQLVVYTPRTSSRNLNRWLFRNSYFYRVALGLRLGRRKDRGALAAEVAEALTALRRAAEEDGATFSVVAVPVLRPPAEWHRAERESRADMVRILDDLDIRWFDLLGTLEAALAAGVVPDESADDRWHPSDEISAWFARDLVRRGLLPGEAERDWP